MAVGGAGGQSRLRVAMVAPPFLSVPPRQYGGTELVVAELVDGLVEAGAEVTLFASGDSTGGFHARCEVRSLFAEARWPPAADDDERHASFAFQAIAAERDRYDLVHVHSPAFLGLARLLKLPTLYTLHHAASPELCRLYRDSPETLFACISARQRELCGPFERSVVIHHGLEPSRYRLGSPRDGVAFLGRLSRVKGPHVAIEAARRAGLTIRVAGRLHAEDKADRAHVERMERLLGEPFVDYQGEVGHEAKVALLSTSRALLFPIDWEEPFGLVAVEAMLCGCPVVAFGRGAIAEIVDEGVTGFICRDAAHMAEVLAGPAHPSRFDRHLCRDRAAARFSAARMVGDYLGAYSAALDVGASALPGRPTLHG